MKEIVLDFSLVKLFLVNFLLYILLFWLFPTYSFVFMYMILGAVIALNSSDRRVSLAVGSMVGLLGSLTATLLLSKEDFIYYMNTMPPIVNTDTPSSLYQHFYELVLLNPIEILGSAAYVIVSFLACAFFSWVSWFLRKRSLVFVALLLVSFNFIFITIYSSGSLLSYLEKEPENLSYGYDAIGYIKTTYLMDNETFYRAYALAQYYDIRRNSTGLAKKEGLDQPVSPLHIRQPFIFYFWKYASFDQIGRVPYLNLILCLTVLWTSYYSAIRLVGNYAIVTPLILVPYLYAGSIWVNIFFPDWWAALFLFVGLMCWTLRRFWFSALLLLMAALSREVIAASLLILLITSYFREKEALKPFIYASLLFALMLFTHYFNADQTFVSDSTRQLADSFRGQFDFRLIQNTNYLMFLYGLYKIPVVLFGFASIISAIILRKLEFIIFGLYILAHNILGPSSYWGMHFMLVILFLLTLLLKHELRISIKA